VFSCGQQNSTINNSQSDNLIITNKSLTIDTFSVIPHEVLEGCGCYYSNDSLEYKQNKFIYANGDEESSFLKINGEITKFTSTDFKQLDDGSTITNYKSDNYLMTIQSKDGNPIGDEAWLSTGTIKLTNKTGKILMKKFYGICGC